MKIIGVTGKSGSGKSTFTEMLSKKLKCNSIDIDKIGHKAVKDKNIAKKLCETFGKEILGENNEIDRKKLGNIVFSSKEKMDKLTDITWKYMQEKLDDMLERETGSAIILEWALLPISKYWEMCDVKILIKADDSERKKRVIQRDNISEEYFEKRDASSIDYTPYEFDYIIENNAKTSSYFSYAK